MKKHEGSIRQQNKKKPGIQLTILLIIKCLAIFFLMNKKISLTFFNLTKFWLFQNNLLSI